MPATPAIFARYVSGALIETGTWHGDGVAAALAAGFPRVCSVELSPTLHYAAAARFAADDRVELWLGLSTECLPEMLADLHTPATFWLDAHYSGGDTLRGPTSCPVLAELSLIAAHAIKRHTILIDDVRLFGTELPVTVPEVRAALHAINPDYVLTYVESGIARLGHDILVARC